MPLRILFDGGLQDCCRLRGSVRAIGHFELSHGVRVRDKRSDRDHAPFGGSSRWAGRVQPVHLEGHHRGKVKDSISLVLFFLRLMRMFFIFCDSRVSDM